MVEKEPRASELFFNYKHLTLDSPEPTLAPFTSLSDLHSDTKTIPSPRLIGNSDINFLSSSSPTDL